MSELKRRSIRAFLWDFGGRVFTRGFGLLVTLVLARLLHPEDFGLIAMCMALIGVASVFYDVGLGSALIQRSEISDDHISTVLVFNVGAGCALAVLLILGAGTVATFFEQPALTQLLLVLSTIFLFNALGATQAALLRRNLEYSAISSARITSSILAGVFAIVLAAFGMGVWSLVGQLVLYALVYNLALWVGSSWRPRGRFSLASLRELWTFGFHMFLAELLQTVSSRLDYVVIGKLFPAATLGFYERSKTLRGIAIQVSSNSLTTVMFPALSQVQNNLPRLRGIVLSMLAFISFVSFLVVGALYVVSIELVVFLLGDNWEVSAEYFQVLIISGFAVPIGALLINVLRSRGKSGLYLSLEVTKKLLVLLNIGVLAVYGIEAFLYGLVLVASISTFINLYFSCRELQVSTLAGLRTVLVQAAMAVFSVAIVLVTRSQLTISGPASIFVEGALYTAFFIALNAVFSTEGYRAVRRQAAERIAPLRRAE